MQTHQPIHQTYRRRMQDWQRSSVRSTPMREFQPDPDAHMFSPDLIEVLEHEEVKARGEHVQLVIETQRLFTYLDFTKHLERRNIVPACTALADGRVPFSVPEGLRDDASRIIVDEAHHAECANTLVCEIVNTTTWTPERLGEPGVVKFLSKTMEGLDPTMAALAEQTFTATSETLITGALMQVPRDMRVHAVVRQVITDHARDESKHHACYSDFIPIMWEQLNATQREFVGPMFAKSIEAFLAPDLFVQQQWLQAACFTPDEARRIVHQTHENRGRGAMREAAHPTLELMKRHGVLECQAAMDAFGMRGLIQDG